MTCPWCRLAGGLHQKSCPLYKYPKNDIRDPKVRIAANVQAVMDRGRAVLVDSFQARLLDGGPVTLKVDDDDDTDLHDDE